MKRLLLMALITIISFFAGALYGGNTHQERTKEIKISRESLNYYPETMPNIVFDLMPNVPY